jgi:hypothetical protein
MEVKLIMGSQLRASTVDIPLWTLGAGVGRPLWTVESEDRRCKHSRSSIHARGPPR